MTGRGRARLKRRLVAELVEDNLRQMRGAPPPRRRASRLLPSLRLLAVALLPLTLFAPSHGASRLDVAAAPGAADGVVAAAAAVATAATSDAPGPAGGASAEALSGAAATGRTHPGRLEPVDSTVFPLAVERVVLDPGHGGRNGGTYTPSGLVEKDLTLDIALRLADLLEDAGFEVLMTRRDDVDLSLEERARFANRQAADLFLSIHVNWIENRGVRGVETYYLGATDDPFLTRLAASENRGSGYSQADLRDLLEELYAGFRQVRSADAAGSLQRTLLRSLRTINPEIEDRGVKTAPFIVLMKTDMPAVLAEVSCLSNQKEAELLARPLYRQYIAEALAAGIESYAAALRSGDAAKDSERTRS